MQMIWFKQIKIFFHFSCTCANEMNVMQIFQSSTAPGLYLVNPDPLYIRPSLSHWDLNKMVVILEKVVLILLSRN